MSDADTQRPWRPQTKTSNPPEVSAKLSLHLGDFALLADMIDKRMPN